MTEKPLQVVVTFDAHGVAEALADVPGVHLAAVGDAEAVAPHVPTADVLLVGDFDAALLARAERLRWVHAASGGVEKMLFPEFVASPIPFTCSKGVFDTPGAEHALASMLGFARNLIYDVQHRPARDYVYGSPTELRGKTLGIAGFGRIGRELARLAQAFGMRVIALRRSDGGEHPHVDEMLHRDELPRLLRESDYLAVAVPNTPETQQLIGASELALMKPSAYLIDVSGRDVIYDLDALADALREGRLAGASLQIAPPPDDSPLWDIDTFHLSFHRATSTEEERRWLDLFTDNLRRFRVGEPLLSLVDKHAGY